MILRLRETKGQCVKTTGYRWRMTLGRSFPRRIFRLFSGQRQGEPENSGLFLVSSWVSDSAEITRKVATQLLHFETRNGPAENSRGSNRAFIRRATAFLNAILRKGQLLHSWTIRKLNRGGVFSLKENTKTGTGKFGLEVRRSISWSRQETGS